MNILVTGSRGFLGKHLVRELESGGHNVFGCDMTHGESPTYMRADVANYRQLKRVFYTFQPNMVYHLAAEFGRHNGEDYYEQLWNTNAVGTKNVIRLCIEYSARLITMSSSEVYGDYEGIMDENLPLPWPPLNDYAATKRVNEWQVKMARGLEAVIVRPFNIFGPGEYYSPYRSVNCRFAYSAIKSMPFTCYRGHSRTSTYISDAIKTLGRIPANFIAGRTYNLAGQQEHTIEELANLAVEIAGANPSLINLTDSEPLTAQHKHVSNELIVNELGHKDNVSLALGMRMLIGWMRDTYGD